MFLSFILVIALVTFIASAFAADPALKSYNIDDDITVSGLSSGGFMAVQVIIYFSRSTCNFILTLFLVDTRSIFWNH
jgi:hypothetical protein